MAELIYEDDELQAFWRQGSTQYLFVTFGDMFEMANSLTFSAEVPVSKNDITCLGIMAKRPNWYPRENLRKLRSAVDEWIKSYDERILYGSSMGGHGAIKASKVLGATTVVALCPQWSINPDDRSAVRLGWEGAFDPSVMSDMKIKADDISGTLFILSDPDHVIDENHRTMIAAETDSCISIPVFASDHHVAPVLAGTKNLQSIIDLCRTNKPYELLRLANKARRPHFARLRCLTERGLQKNASLTLKVLFNALPNNEAVPAVLRDLQELVHEAAATHADVQTWTKYVKWRVDQSEDPFDKLRLLSLYSHQHSSEPYLGIFTTFGTQLYFDVTNNELRHGSVHRRDWAAVAFSRNSDLVRLETAKQVPLDAGFGEAVFKLRKLAGGAFALSNKDKFLSADPSGSFACDRGEAQGWETFTSRLILPDVRGT
jgi:hypothetical protein